MVDFDVPKITPRLLALEGNSQGVVDLHNLHLGSYNRTMVNKRDRIMALHIMALHSLH